MTIAPNAVESSSAGAWAKALENTAPIARHPERIFPIVLEEQADEFGSAPALVSASECFTYRHLADRANRYARWALAQHISKGDCIGLLMPNRPEFMAIWMGVSRTGAIVALLNTNLSGRSLAHCINAVSPKHVIAASELIPAMRTALNDVAADVTIWVHGSGDTSFPRLDTEIEHHSRDTLRASELTSHVTIADPALYIYTSGTTGLPKAAVVSHGRIMQWTHWFAGLMQARRSDRMYNCLPMYHGVGGVQAPGAILAAGGCVVVRDKFSASQFWNDIVRWDCTIFQYIGELCRYLLNSSPEQCHIEHQLRLACGNGLRPDIWREFQRRFHIPRILEFYASTEGTASLFNVDGEPGSIGRIPPYLAHRFPVLIIKLDANNAPVRSEQGFCVRCAHNEVGEAIGPVLNESVNVANRFDGYTNTEASDKKILRNVFQPGDTWFRTGDLMRKDERGFFYFVDRIGDTFRWKGENVSTLEVSQALCEFPGVKEANVYGVEIPGADGRAGMAAVVASGALDLED